MSDNIPDDIIDLDELLHGDPTFEQVIAFWKFGEWYERSYQVEAIKRWLRTPEQKKVLDDLDLSIDDMLCGRYYPKAGAAIVAIYREWNAKLGYKAFRED